jgi:hypothetical protein
MNQSQKLQKTKAIQISFEDLLGVITNRSLWKLMMLHRYHLKLFWSYRKETSVEKKKPIAVDKAIENTPKNRIAKW